MLSILAMISIHLMLSTAARLDDEISLRKLQLQDLESEQNQREYEREELTRLQQQQPPLPPAHHSDRATSHIAQNAQSAFSGSRGANRNPNSQQTLQHFVAQSVRPLDQPITAAKPIRPPGADYATAAASNFNFGINPLSHNGLNEIDVESDIDNDIVTFSHDDAPLPLHLRRPQIELLSAGGAGYALSGADVLLPPFHDHGVGSFLGDLNQAQQRTPNRFTRPPQLPYNAYEHNQSPAASNFASSNKYSDDSGERFEFPQGYLPMNKFGSHIQPIQYGSPQASFRRPNIYAQSNQLAFAPPRPEGSNTLTNSAVKIPFPPSFITLTTQRPETNYIPMAVRPLGRSLGYKSQFRPSAADPVPDFFVNRQSKSLLDSYIPSWVVAKMLEEQRSNAFESGNIGGYDGYFANGRHFKRAVTETAAAQSRNDESNMKISIDGDQSNSKVVKKSLDTQLTRSTPAMMMMMAA